MMPSRRGRIIAPSRERSLLAEAAIAMLAGRNALQPGTSARRAGSSASARTAPSHRTRFVKKEMRLGANGHTPEFTLHTDGLAQRCAAQGLLAPSRRRAANWH